MLRLLAWFLAFLVPATIIVTFFFPQYWEILLLNLVFYSKLILKLAKTEILLFISKMTVLKLIILAVKRFVMDNIVSKAISEHFMAHVAPEAKKWWKSLDIKELLFWFIPASMITVISTWIAGIANTTLFLFIKTLIIGFFKLLWLILAKIFLFFSNSFFTQVFELLAISYLLGKVSESKTYCRFVKPCWANIKHWLSSLNFFLEDKIQNPINKKVNELGAKTAEKIRFSRKKKQMDNLSTNPEKEPQEQQKK